MSVYNNCYVYRGNDNIIIDTLSTTKWFKGNDLSYNHNGKGELTFVRDMKGNYYYLAEDCLKIQ